MKTAKDLKAIADQSQLPNEEEKKMIETIIDACEQEAKKGKYQTTICGYLYMPHGFPEFRDSIIYFYRLDEYDIRYKQFENQLEALGFYVKIEAATQDYFTNPMDGSSKREIEITIKWGED